MRCAADYLAWCAEQARTNPEAFDLRMAETLGSIANDLRASKECGEDCRCWHCRVEQYDRDSDGTEGEDPNGASVPQDCQARAESIAQTSPANPEDGGVTGA